MKRAGTYLLLLSFLAGCELLSMGSGAPSHAAQAEMLRREGKTAEAVSEYESHILERLKNPLRPQDENPYFYYIHIGDIYREAGQFDKAIEAYGKAQQNDVEPVLVADRIILIAETYRKENRFDAAFALLRRFRELDPLLMDGQMDELHKAQVEMEQSGY